MRALTIPKFEKQPYFELTENGILDARIPNLEIQAPATDLLNDREIAFVHNLSNYAHVGSDGDDVSGAVEMIDIKTVEGKELTALRSIHSFHNSGLAYADHSWSMEFQDSDLAHSFWKSSRSKSFSAKEVMGRLKDFVITRKIPVPLSGHFQELGQLQPWYMQKEGEQIFLEYYTTFQGRLLAEPRLEPSTELRVGQLCIVPEFVSVWTRDVAAYKVKTCLGAYVVPSSTSYMGHQQEAYPVVQWDDGSRTFGRDRGGPQPMALTEEHLYKRVPRAKANAV